MAEDYGRIELVHVHDSHFDASAAGTTIARYVYQADAPLWESPKPYFAPLRTLSGDVVTVFRPYDHPWHKGLYLGLPYVGDENLYGGPTFDGQNYVFLDNNGSMRHETFERLMVMSSQVVFSERLAWLAHDGRRIAEERRSVSINVPGIADGAWYLRFLSRIYNNGEEPLVFSSPTVRGRPQAGYGGLMWRGPRSFTGGQILGPDGRSGPQMMGQRAQWVAFIGHQDGKDLSVRDADHQSGRDVRDNPAAQSTIVFVDAAASTEPTQWFVRSEPYAMIGSAPFFDRDVIVPQEESLKIACSVVVADGAWAASDIEKYLAVNDLASAEQEDSTIGTIGTGAAL